MYMTEDDIYMVRIDCMKLYGMTWRLDNVVEYSSGVSHL